MRNNKGFTLIELLAVIVVLAIVMVLAATTVLPYMSSARENAFKVEATNVVKAAENAKNLYTLGQIKVGSGNTAANSCAQGTKMCFTVDDLIALGVYDGDADTFSGKVTITSTTNSTTYELYLNKNNEFMILGGNVKDYTNKYTESLSGKTWPTDSNGVKTGEVCSCS